jgi:hypothetical protein
MRDLHLTRRAEPAARAVGRSFFGWWYFADGAKEAAPA